MLAGTQPYVINNEYQLADIISHFDADYIFHVVEDKLKNISFTNSLIETNIVDAFESNFKKMNDDFPGDSQNIRNIREQVYRDLIRILTERFNLSFNTVDDTIDVYTAAYYLYDFLVSNRNNIMINFFVSFIINNKESLCNLLDMDNFKKNKDSSSAYSKYIYDDNKFAIISANIQQVINYISTLDVSLVNIFQSSYKDLKLVMFLDNAFADKGNFFRDFYCSILSNPEESPIVITNIRLSLQGIVGGINNNNISTYLSYEGE